MEYAGVERLGMKGRRPSSMLRRFPCQRRPNKELRNDQSAVLLAKHDRLREFHKQMIYWLAKTISCAQ